MSQSRVQRAGELMQQYASDLVSSDVERVRARELEAIDHRFSQERHSLLGEVMESAAARWLPRWSKAADLLTATGIKEGDPEVVVWQKEFESITARTMFIPNFILKYATDPILQIPGFIRFVENYPLGGVTKSRLLNAMKEGGEVRGSYVVDFLRLVHQDMITGLVSFKKVSGDQSVAVW